MRVQTTVWILLLAAMIFGGASPQAAATFLQRDDAKHEFASATAICKIKFVKLTEAADTHRAFVSGGYYPCTAQCEVIATFKGKMGNKTDLVFNRGHQHFFSFEGKVGETCLVMVDDKGTIISGVTCVENTVDPVFGQKTGDRLLAEFIAMCKSDKPGLRLRGLQELMELADPRGGEEAMRATHDKDEKIARAGIIAQYRMKIAPDVGRIMELFNSQLLYAAYEEAGVPQEDAQGNSILRVQVLDGKETKFFERGMPDFDYARFVREGIKQDWVRKDKASLYSFFGVPWKVQRKACVPELIRLLTHEDMRVRWWADTCLKHTVYNIHDQTSLEDYQKMDAATVQRWKDWWNAKGEAYMAVDVAAKDLPSQ